MTQQKASERRIQELSEFDALTGLLNKKSFHDKLQDAIQHAETHHELLSLLWFNIDNFKAINDTLGHEAGDATLVIFAQRLLDGLGSKYVIARYSGDTFAAIIPDHQQTAVAVMAADILSKLKADFTINDQKLSMTASVGIAVFPDDANAAGSLSSAAEIAMYRAKEDGRNSLRFYSGELQEHTKRSLDLSLSLNGAHERGELYVVYQPQLDCTSGQIVGAEALLRWNHPKWGHVTPSEFIPLAEQTGQIIPIGLWVLEQVAHQIQHWDQAGLQKFRFAINVSAVQFVRPGFVDDIVNVMSQASLSTDRIELEITEAVALIDAEQAVKIIQCLHDVGFNVALDDFGTGYSSLSYLKRYAIDKLKIDQSFIQDFDRTKGDHSIVSAIIQIAHSMGIKTIAEGVETTDQLAMLRALGCDEVQGFLLSEPISADAFYHFAQSETRLNTLFSS